METTSDRPKDGTEHEGRGSPARRRPGFSLTEAFAGYGGDGSAPSRAEPPFQHATQPRTTRKASIASALDGAARRGLDVVTAGTLLVLLLPLILVAAVAIRLDSRGPTFYRAPRAGYRGRELHMLKFRKMHLHAAGMKLTFGDDQRFTRVGRWLARTKLDEIPQLWHVVRGEMSLVGPRPEDPSFVALEESAYTRILEVRPGMTGYSQLAFAAEGEILDTSDPVAHYLDRLFPQKVALDRMYVDHRSFRLNVRVLFWTVAAVLLRRHVAVHRSSGEMNLRLRPD